MASTAFPRADPALLDPIVPFYGANVQSGPNELGIMANEANFSSRRAALVRSAVTGATTATGLQFVVRLGFALMHAAQASEPPHAHAAWLIATRVSPAARVYQGAELIGKGSAIAGTVVYAPTFYRLAPASNESVLTGFVSIAFSWGEARYLRCHPWPPLR